MVDVSIPIRYNKVSRSILICTGSDALESKSSTIILATLENLFKMITPAILEVEGGASRELGRDKVRDQDTKLEHDVDFSKVASLR